MKKIIILLLASLFMSYGMPVNSYGQTKKPKTSKSTSKKTVYVKGYTKKNGKYVKPYYRSKPSKK